jgi:hypothetical protein
LAIPSKVSIFIVLSNFRFNVPGSRFKGYYR